MRALSLVVATIAALTVSAPPLPASADPRIKLANLDITYQPGLSYPSGEWTTSPRRGDWRVTGGRLGADGRLTLDVEIRPPEVSLPIDPGPAVLFGWVTLYGGYGGDVGASVDVRRVAVRSVSACPDEANCIYRTSITLPTDRLPRLARRYDADSWSGADIGLVLVRTFGQGSWFEVLPLYDETAEESAGTVGRPIPYGGSLLALGAFSREQGDRSILALGRRARRLYPILGVTERLRQAESDTSARPHLVSALIEVDPTNCRREGWTLFTETGDVAYDVSEHGPYPQAVRLSLPDPASWTLAVPSLDRVDNVRYVTPFGPITTDGQPVRIAGRWSCQDGASGYPEVNLSLRIVVSPDEPIGVCPGALGDLVGTLRPRGQLPCAS